MLNIMKSISTKIVHGLRATIGSNRLNGAKLEFEWRDKEIKKVAEVFKSYDPAPETENISNVKNPGDEIPDQPEWDLQEPEAERDHLNDNPEDNDPNSVWIQRDVIAWYCPASFHPSDKYGIYFDVAKVRRLGLRLNSYGGQEIQEDDWLIAAIITCFWHEICHAWIEDICHLIDPNKRGSAVYRNTHYKYRGYIFMEEAICNTVALWMVQFFFKKHKAKAKIFESIQTFMRSQGRGYRSFCDCGQWPSNSDRVSANISKLLSRVYGFSPSQLIDHAVNVFLQPPSYWGRFAKKATKGSMITKLYMSSKEYPLYTHPADAEKKNLRKKRAKEEIKKMASRGLELV